ncbi:hypothetical protein ASG49_04765 [Marmoricola sp. Leaf446]|uniref:DUF305 domain-containing protein n=1 Tax=Marmoricola sp. Leaf446 TaxID=1736379 RepID=UPI0006F33595|nr:DUF305 domain-containing protein [Marmoricola sp. Leaf446]KQT94217.1 hypothetical protein ASG49_04765 [Marmoricola sp. Leaf446]
MSATDPATDPATSPTTSPRRHLSRGLLAAVVALVVLAALGGAAVGAALASRDPSAPVAGQRSGMGSGTGTGMGMGADVGEERFLVDMVAHHEEAITAARELRRSERPEMRAFGRRVVADQSAQVEQMRAWSSQWFDEAPTASTYEPMMRDLTRLDGDRLDEAFLADMTQHHMTAVMMARRLLAGDRLEHAELGSLARTIVRDQTAEIAQMHRWSRAWFGRSWTEGGMMPGGPMGDGS